MPQKSKDKFSPFEQELAHSLADLPPRKMCLIGVSGGMDSMALLHGMMSLGFKNLIVCHLDHALRGRASKTDAKFVMQTAHQLGLDFEAARAYTQDYASACGKSIELAARDLRYAFFEECSRRRKCRRLLLAHQANDQVETCLFQFFRGSGAAGLAGMRKIAKRGSLQIIRPMLGITREKIENYVHERKIRFREDATNIEASYTRNRIRHQVIPTITRSFGPSFKEAILRASEIFRQENDWMEMQVPRFASKLPCHQLRLMHPALQYRTVLRWLRERGVPEPGFLETRRILSLLDLKNGPAKINLPGNFHARRRTGEIFIERGPSRK